MTHSEPSESKWNGLPGIPDNAARIFVAIVWASRSANWAVGGHGFPVFPSLTAAQSPSAQTPGYPGTERERPTTTAPRLFFSNASDFSNGLGAVPAVHIRVSAVICPSLRLTRPGWTSANRASRRNFTPLYFI